MIDIGYDAQGLDAGTFDTQTFKAANILGVQLGALEYAQDLGIDLKYFLTNDFEIQNESFEAYCVQVLAQNGVNVTGVTKTIENLLQNLTFNIAPLETSTGLLAR